LDCSKEGPIRDPNITLGPDHYYYLTGTTINQDDPRGMLPKILVHEL